MSTGIALLAMVPISNAQDGCHDVGTATESLKISQTSGGFGGDLDTLDRFGSAVANLGDLDGDGVDDLAVGAELDDDGGTDRGAVWILLLTPAGNVKEWHKISSAGGLPAGSLANDDRFGVSIVCLGDLEGDATLEIAVGAHHDDDGATEAGAVWILSLDDNGAVNKATKVSSLTGGFTGDLDSGDQFGYALEAIEDLDGDGIPELAVGAEADDDGGENRGAVWILFLDPQGTVKHSQKISALSGGFAGDLSNLDYFGRAIASLGDLDGDGIGDIAVGAEFDDDGGEDAGAVWVLYLNADGTVKAEQKVSAISGGFGGALQPGCSFGGAATAIGDLDDDGLSELAVGAPRTSDGGPERGAIWVLHLNSDGTVRQEQRLSQTAGGFGGTLVDAGYFGSSIAATDRDQDGRVELTIGQSHDDDGDPDCGAIWLVELCEWPRGCYADCDADLVLSIDDFVCFQTRFAVGDPAADCDGDLALSIDDFICFQTAFAQGC